MRMGENSAAASYAVILVHGFLDAAEIWSGVVTHLADSAVIPTSMDLPGMGALSNHAGELSLEGYAALVSQEIGRTDLPVILVGQSMGAQIVELAAAAHPGKVVALVLVTPVPLGGVNAPPEVIAPFKALGGNPAAQRDVRASLSPALKRDQLDRLGCFGEKVPPTTVAHLVDIWNEGNPQGMGRSGFTGPVVILRGTADSFVTEDMAKAVGDRFINSHVNEVAGGGHWLHVEQPNCVAEAIFNIVAGLAATDGDWQQAFKQRSADAFAEAFAEDVRLEAAVLYAPIHGRNNIKQVMEAASKIYDHLEFVAQAAQDNVQYLQWKAQAFGGTELFGVTVIARNEAGAIQNVAIHHRPLGAALKFSTALAERLTGVIDPSHFLSAADLPADVRSKFQ